MLCVEFEDRLTDYLEGVLPPAEHIAFAEHALRCPVCHEVLNEVKSALEMCHQSEVPVPPSVELEANILRQTAPETLMACEEFEEHLTDYLDGFLPAALYHRWERHAAMCQHCTDLPGQVVRSIGACYSYINEELPVPAGLRESILQATLGTVQAEERRAPLGARVAEWLRGWLDPIVSPQLATVATMLLLAVLVLTNTVSTDGSITGMYQASLHLAERTYEHSTGLNKGVGVNEGWKKLESIQMALTPEAKKEPEQKKPENK
jgi:anti-sigma factor RsiW